MFYLESIEYDQNESSFSNSAANQQSEQCVLAPLTSYRRVEPLRHSNILPSLLIQTQASENSGRETKREGLGQG